MTKIFLQLFTSFICKPTVEREKERERERERERECVCVKHHVQEDSLLFPK